MEIIAVAVGPWYVRCSDLTRPFDVIFEHAASEAAARERAAELNRASVAQYGSNGPVYYAENERQDSMSGPALNKLLQSPDHR